MEVTSFTVSLTSERPEALIAFYRDVLQLPEEPEMGEGSFKAGPISLLVDGHSETHGKAREPQRVMINFFVADIEAEQQRLLAQGVPCIRDKGKEYWGGVISTFTDPDGNYIQLIQFRPE